MTSISKLGRPYENGKALDVSTRRLVITDLIDGMSAKAVGKKYKLGTKVVTKIKYRYEQDGTVFPTNRKFTTGNPKKLDKNDIDFIRHLKQVKPSISYNEIYNQVTQFCHLPSGTSRSAIGRAVRDDLQMTYKRLTKAKAEKFTPQNIAYCQAFLDYMATVPKHKVKFFDEAGLDLLVCNPVYGHSEKNTRAVEVVSGKKGPSWTLMLLCSLDGIDYAKMIPVPANTVEYLRFFGEANMFRSPMGNAMFKNGDHVVVDNAPFHRGAASPVLGNWLGRQGTGLVYTPYYSPEFNAAELVFNYLKIMLKNNNIRQMAHRNLPAVVYGLLDNLTPRHMLAFINELGYLMF